MTDQSAYIAAAFQRFAPQHEINYFDFSDSEGQKIRAALSTRAKGTGSKATIVFLPGYTLAIETYHNAINRLHELADRIYIFDWHGQGASDRAYPSDIPGRTSQIPPSQTVMRNLRDLDKFMRDVVLPETDADSPLIMVGHSMGSHMGLRHLHEQAMVPQGKNRRAFNTAVLATPLLQFQTHAIPHLFAETAIAITNRIATKKRHLPVNVDWKFMKRAQRLFKPRNSDALKRTRMIDPIYKHFWNNRDDLTLGPPSVAWFHDIMKSMHHIMRPDFMGRIDTPLLIGAVEHDHLVGNRSIRRVLSWLPNAHGIIVDGAQHDIWQEDDTYMDPWMDCVHIHVRRTLAQRFPEYARTPSPNIGFIEPAGPAANDDRRQRGRDIVHAFPLDRITSITPHGGVLNLDALRAFMPRRQKRLALK